MEPYYGHHPSKQFLRGKPVRFGYKVWCLATSTGYLVKFTPYTGKDERQPGLGLGSSVVKNLAADTVVKKAGHHIYIDNYFTSLRLLRELVLDGTYTALEP